MSAENKIENAAEDFAGKAKEGLGQVTDDDRLVAEGRTDQAKAAVKGAGEKVADAVKDAGDKIKDVFKK